MAKGQAQAADTNLSTTNAIGSNELGQANNYANMLAPAYQTEMDTGYFSPQEQEAATNTTMGAAAAPFQAADFAAKDTAAATRNPADLTASEDQLALEKGETAGNAANTLEQEKLQNQQAGAAGLYGLESGELGAGTSMYGLGPSTLQARAAGQSPLQSVGGILGGAGGLINAFKGGGGGGGGCWIAAALYDGWDDPRTIDVRRWLNTEFIKTLHGRVVMAAYVALGRPVAWCVERSELLKKIFRPLFDRALARARGH